MARRKQPDRSGQNPRRSKKQQPYARKKDLQQACDWSSERSNTANSNVNQFLDAEVAKRDEFFNTETQVKHDEFGNKMIVHKTVMSGDFNPMKIAAVCLGVSGMFIVAAVVLAFTGPPGAASDVLTLALIGMLASIALAWHESQTRRIEATKTIITVPFTPSGAANFNVKPETLLRQSAEEPHTPRALDGGEPTV